MTRGTFLCKGDWCRVSWLWIVLGAIKIIQLIVLNISSFAYQNGTTLRKAERRLRRSLYRVHLDFYVPNIFFLVDVPSSISGQKKLRRMYHHLYLICERTKIHSNKMYLEYRIIDIRRRVLEDFKRPNLQKQPKRTVTFSSRYSFRMTVKFTEHSWKPVFEHSHNH